MSTNFAIRYASHCVRHGGVIVYPTETLYGIGCDPFCEDAVSTINNLKNRQTEKSFILLANKLEQLDKFIEPLTKEHEKMVSSTQTPTSWITPANSNVPPWLVNADHTIAFRVTVHPVVAKLCDLLNHPLISTSVNPSRKKPALTTLQIHRYFHDRVDHILISGYRQTGKPSVIKYMSNTKAKLRQGTTP